MKMTLRTALHMNVPTVCRECGHRGEIAYGEIIPDRTECEQCGALDSIVRTKVPDKEVSHGYDD